MNGGNHYRDNGGYCYFHPKEVVVGVCHLCLNERLLILAAKQGVNSKSSNYTSKRSNFYDNSYHDNYIKPKPYVTLPKIFAIASFFNPRDNHRRRHRQSDHHDFFDDADATSTSLEEDDSFISIKFGDNGVASWDKTSSKGSKVALEQHCSLSWGGQTAVKDATIKGSGSNNSNKSVVEHAKPRAASLRWRKRIAQLLQVIRWKKSSKANAGAGGGNNNSSKVVEGVKVVRNNKDWIRTSKSRTKE